MNCIRLTRYGSDCHIYTYTLEVMSGGRKFSVNFSEHEFCQFIEGQDMWKENSEVRNEKFNIKELL